MTNADAEWPYLTDGEQNTCDEYCGGVKLMDWKGYDEAQDRRRRDAWHWLNDRLEELHELIDESSDDENVKNHRHDRRDYLDRIVNGGYRKVQRPGPNYPADYATDAEAVYIEEREYYLAYTSAYDEQKARKTANLNWLQERRKYVWRCAEGKIEDEDPGWNIRNREIRYDNLCIATHYGSAWEDWKKTHDTATGDPLIPTSGTKGRDAALKWMADHRGITEDPVNSNCDNRSDGIRAAQDRCAGGSDWLRYQPWCGVWCFNALRAAGVEGLNSNMASVAWIESQARAGKAPFTSWTTDGSSCKPGDLVVLFGSGQHVGMVREVHPDYVDTEEGNTTVGNNGGSAQKQRSRHGDTYGYARVRYP